MGTNKAKKKVGGFTSKNEINERLAEIEEEFAAIETRAIVVLIFTILAGKLFVENPHPVFKNGLPLFDLLVFVNDLVEWRGFEKEKEELIQKLKTLE